MTAQSSWLDDPAVRKVVEAEIGNGLSNAAIAANLTARYSIPTSESAIRRARKRWGITGSPDKPDQPRFTQKDDKAEIVSQVSAELDTPEDMMRERGLDPDDWEITGIKVNQWDSNAGGGNIIKLRQLTVQLVRKKPEPAFLTAARPDGPSFRTQVHPSQHSGEPRTVVFVGDQQAPFHDPHLHELFCQWLEENQPEQGILIGDTVDFPDISRHRYNPERNATVQECVQAGYGLLRDYRAAAPETFWEKMSGNHDERLRNTLIDWATELYAVSRARIDEHDEEPPVLSVENLLRLDELGIEYVDPNGQYDQAQVNVSKYLAARHGWIAVKGSGASALKTLEHLGYSIVVGHTHRQSIVYKTTHNINGESTTLVGVETGCMCSLDMGYAVAPDWQQGFATATIWPDGVFKMDLATYFDNTLVWRDQRYGGR